MHLSWPLSVLTACLFVCLSDRVFARDLNRPVYAIVCPPCPALPCPVPLYTTPKGHCRSQPPQDLRNHGDSPHDPRHDYTALAEDVEDFIDQHKLQNSTLIGHSMCVPPP